MPEKLVQEPRTDKNGVTSKRWVRPPAAPSESAKSLPAPNTPMGGFTEDMQTKSALLNEISESFNGRKDSAALVYRESMKSLGTSDDIPLLRTVASITKESQLSINSVVWHYNRMQRLGVEHPAATLTTDLISIYITVQTHLGILSARAYERTRILDAILVSNDKDAALIEDAVVNREMTSSEDVLELVASMKAYGALSEGAL